MKPFARINLSSAALRRVILVSSIALAAAVLVKWCRRSKCLYSDGVPQIGDKVQLCSKSMKVCIVYDGYVSAVHDSC